MESLVSGIISGDIKNLFSTLILFIMKKKFLLLSLAIAGAASAVNAQEVIFDFSNPTSLSGLTFEPMNVSELQQAKYENESEKSPGTKDRCYLSGKNHVLIIIGETISKDGVSFSLTNPDKYKDYPRFFFGLIGKTYPDTPTAADFYCDLRWYQTEEIEISAPAGKKIDKIVMNAKSGDHPARANGHTKVVTEGGTQTISDDLTLNEWVANADSEITKVTYKATSDSPTQMAYSLAVTLSDLNGGSGISSIGSDDSNAPVEYYDLTGVRCNPDNLTPGIYVMRKGASVKKVSIK